MSNFNIRRIILSGGWGYGNLGDDAILIATIKLLKDKFPNVFIYILTYNVNETKIALREFDHIEIYESLHVTIYGVKPYGKVDLSQSLKDKILRKIGGYKNKDQRALKDMLNNETDYFSKMNVNVSKFETLCNEADLYLMSGGGYILDWAESLISKYYEIKIAKGKGLKCFTIGQTVGPFNYVESDKLAQKLYRYADGAFFRDKESIKEIQKWNIECHSVAVPDIALSDIYSYRKKEYIVYIPFCLEPNTSIENVVTNLRLISEYKKLNICIVLSQLWIRQFKLATALYFELLKLNIKVSFFVPNDVFELQKILAESSLVISQNLHGLILSYRAGTPVISINARRKFKTFMEMIDGEKYLLPFESINNHNLLDLVKMNMDDRLQSKCNLFKKQIYDAFDVVVYENLK